MFEIGEISQLITTVGFPIVCCIVMFRQNGKLQETLAEISVTMQKMADKIAELEDKIK